MYIFFLVVANSQETVIIERNVLDYKYSVINSQQLTEGTSEEVIPSIWLLALEKKEESFMGVG